jgi:hypothetical protein
VIPLLLDPRSNSSLYEHRDHTSLVVPGQDFFALRIAQECGGGLCQIGRVAGSPDDKSLFCAK